MYEQYIKGYQTWKQSLTLLQVELVNWFDLCFLKNVSLFKHFLQLSLTVWRLFYWNSIFKHSFATFVIVTAKDCLSWRK